VVGAKTISSKTVMTPFVAVEQKQREAFFSEIFLKVLRVPLGGVSSNKEVHLTTAETRMNKGFQRVP